MDREYKPAASSEEKPFRGLYRNVKISVRSLDLIIAGCAVVMLLLVAAGLANPGYTVAFDSRGGTDVAAQKQMYGETLAQPAPPTREGYAFTGWYLDRACSEPWNPQWVIQDNVTL